MRRRILSMLLAVIMCLSLLPVTALAADAGKFDYTFGSITPDTEKTLIVVFDEDQNIVSNAYLNGEGKRVAENLDEAKTYTYEITAPGYKKATGTITKDKTTGDPIVMEKIDNEVTWAVEGDTLTVSGNFAMEDYASRVDTQWWDTEGFNNVTRVVVESGITRIGARAFAYPQVTSVEIPNTVKSIGKAALGFTGMTALTIPASVTSIEDSAFDYSKNLVLTFEGNAPAMASDVFDRCEGLTVKYPAGNKTWESVAGQDYGASDTVTWAAVAPTVSHTIETDAFRLDFGDAVVEEITLNMHKYPNIGERTVKAVRLNHGDTFTYTNKLPTADDCHFILADAELFLRDIFGDPAYYGTAAYVTDTHQFEYAEQNVPVTITVPSVDAFDKEFKIYATYGADPSGYSYIIGYQGKQLNGYLGETVYDEPVEGCEFYVILKDLGLEKMIVPELPAEYRKMGVGFEIYPESVYEVGFTTVVKDSAGKVIEQNEIGEYSDCLDYGETYSYTVSAPGYQTVNGSFTAERNAEGYVLVEVNMVPGNSEVVRDIRVEGLEEEVPYTGKAVTQDLRVSADGNPLTEGKDYTVSYKKNKAVGEATATIKFKGAYKSVKPITLSFRIYGIAMSELEARWNDEPIDLEEGITVPYTGKAQKLIPALVNPENGVALKAKTDYTITYEGKMTNVDEANCIVLTGKGGYEGQIRIPVHITTVDLSGAVISPIRAATFTGKPITPKLTVKLGKTTLKQDVHFEAEFSDNVNTGTAAVTIRGIGNYEGTCTATFSIKGISISKAKMSGFVSSMPYEEGEEAVQHITLTYGGETLTEGEDYTISYENNDGEGTATMYVYGEGNFHGTQFKKTFKITKVAIKKAKLTGLVSSMPYTGEEVTQEGYELVYTVKGAEPMVLEKGEDYTVRYEKNVNAGTATIYFDGCGSFSGTMKKTFKITPVMVAESDEIAIEVEDGVFVDGKTPVTPEVFVTFKGEELTLGKDYTVKYSNNKAAASAEDDKAPTVTVTFKGNFKGKLTETFNITE